MGEKIIKFKATIDDNLLFRFAAYLQKFITYWSINGSVEIIPLQIMGKRFAAVLLQSRKKLQLPKTQFQAFLRPPRSLLSYML